MPARIYAELLTNIRYISLTISLPADRETWSSLEVVVDASTASVRSDELITSINLPAQVSEKSQFRAHANACRPNAKNECHFRLETIQNERSETRLLPSWSENIVRWTANDLGSALSCASCKMNLLRPDLKIDWRDLPSDDWAEMMDFWHCHKPHEDEKAHDHDIGEVKGYGHANQLRCVSGIGWSGLSTILLHADDCINIKTALSSANDHHSPPLILTCASCNKRLGIEDSSANGWKLDKWAFSLDDGTSHSSEIDIARWTAARLLSLIERTSLRKFVATTDGDDDSDKEALELWVFSEDLSFSVYSEDIASEQRKQPTRAMKVFSKQVQDKSLTESLQHEHLNLPSDAFRAIRSQLDSTRALLPVSSRVFQQWQVGLLSRFAQSPISPARSL